MDVIVARCAGLDVHKNTVMACVRAPGPDGGRISTVRRFGTFTDALRQLRAWLVAEGVTQVAMEATGVYWKPVVRHEAPGIEWRCKDFTAGQSQLAGEAGSSRDVGTHATVGAAPTTYGTGRHCQTARVRQAVMRRRTRGTAVRSPVSPEPGSKLTDRGRCAARGRYRWCGAGLLRSRFVGPVGRPRRRTAA